jgi:hypothetical protein
VRCRIKVLPLLLTLDANDPKRKLLSDSAEQNTADLKSDSAEIEDDSEPMSASDSLRAMAATNDALGDEAQLGDNYSDYDRVVEDDVDVSILLKGSQNVSLLSGAVDPIRICVDGFGSDKRQSFSTSLSPPTSEKPLPDIPDTTTPYRLRYKSYCQDAVSTIYDLVLAVKGKNAPCSAETLVFLTRKMVASIQNLLVVSLNQPVVFGACD